MVESFYTSTSFAVIVVFNLILRTFYSSLNLVELQLRNTIRSAFGFLAHKWINANLYTLFNIMKQRQGQTESQNKRRALVEPRRAWP